MKNKIYVVLPVFNRLRYTRYCLSAIKKQTYKNYKIILVNDGSSDNTYAYVKQKYPEISVISGDGNWWWTKSMYKGVKLALKTAKRGDYILELNNDLFFGKEYFAELIRFAHKHRNALVGSICVRAQNPNHVVEAGIRIDWPSGLVYGVAPTISKELSYFKNMESIKDLDALPGKGTLVPIKVFKKAGNFNYNRFPHYIADYEFSNRAKRNGFELLIDPRAIAKHYWMATGISLKKSARSIGLTQAINFLFGRKSMNNIVDWVNFINYACPPRYRARNYYYASTRLFKGIFLIKYLSFLKPIVGFFVLLNHSLNYPKLALYRIMLKIKQFPEYHLK